MMRQALACLVCLSFFSLTPTFAGRPDKEWKKWFGHISGGWSFQRGDSGDVLDDDFIHHLAGKVATGWLA